MSGGSEGGGPVLTAHYEVEIFTYGATTVTSENQVATVTLQSGGDADSSNSVSSFPLSSDTADTESCRSECVSVRVQSATTTRGGQIVSDAHDATGILIWPATHVLCQYLVQQHYQRDWTFLQGPPRSRPTFITEPPLVSLIDEEVSTSFQDYSEDTMAILELGCGCGLVGVVAAALALQKSSLTTKLLWVSTDRDEAALAQCRYNFSLNGIAVQETAGEITSHESDKNITVLVSKLEWGYAAHHQALLRRLEQYRRSAGHATNAIAGTRPRRFDAIVAADIVYPTTCRNHILPLLLNTVDALLAKHGIFWLAFWSRDGPRTPCHFIEAASAAGYRIDAVVTDQSKMATPTNMTVLPGAQLLQLYRCPNAALYNARLGASDCLVFPALKEAKARLEAAERDAPEEWNAPPCDD
jgi:Lysine methyltransferase